MDFRLKPKEEKFFRLLNDHAQLCLTAAELMAQAFEGEEDKHVVLHEITRMELEADELVEKTAAMLMKTFITPMDREDIQTLVDQLDNTIDDMKEIMDKMCMYHVDVPSDGAVELAGIIRRCLKHIAKSIDCMGNLKKQHLKVEAHVKKVFALEEKADNIYHEEMAHLFTECDNPIEIIKWKDIFDSMEHVIDGCEKLVGTFRRVVLKYA